jgi:hypothetical protein
VNKIRTAILTIPVVSKGAALPYCRNSTENQESKENDPLASVSNVDFSRLPVHRIEHDGEANYGRNSRLSELRSIHIISTYDIFGKIRKYIHTPDPWPNFKGS